MNSQKSLDALFLHATEGIVVVNDKGEIVKVNPSAERLFAYEKDELIGKRIEALVPKRFSKEHKTDRENYHRSPHARSMGVGMDLFGLRKNGTEFPIEISLSPYSTADGNFVVAFIIDITVRKRAEEEAISHQKKLEVLTKELKASNERLEIKVQERTKVLQEALSEIEKSRAELSEALEKEKELNELKSRFLSMASHEFRTPLTTILSSASLIPEYALTEQQEKRVKHVDRIKSAVNNLNDILSDFLSLSKIEEGKVSANFKKFNLKKLSDEICSELKVLCKTGQQIIHTHEGNEEAELDGKLIRNVINNLLSNAIKFSEENKKVFLNTSVTKSLVKIEVKDQGIGISEEDKKHLFERFFRGDNAVNIQGTGLGLNIVAKYVELMNGYIEFDSNPQQGTTFVITFTTL